MGKERAEQNYEDTIAGGHSAFMMKVDENKNNMYILNLGNIRPGEFASVHIVILQSLQIVEGSYHFAFPMSYLPLKPSEPKDCESEFSFKF